MKRPWNRPLGCLVIALAAGLVFFEVAVEYIGDGFPTYTVTVETANPHPIRWAGSFWVSGWEDGERALNRWTGADAKPVESTEEVTDRSFEVHSGCTTRRSPFRIWRNSFVYIRWVVIVIEFADGSRWAKVEELPDPRTSKAVTCRIEEGRRLRPAKP
jgi:hypothetical protein